MALFLSSSRLNGEEGRQFLPVVVKHFARLSKVLLVSCLLYELRLVHWHFVYVTEYLVLYFFLQNKGYSFRKLYIITTYQQPY